MALQLTVDDAGNDQSFEHQVHEVAGRTEYMGIIQVELCCEQMDHQAPWLIEPLLGDEVPPEIGEDRIRVLATGALETVIAAFESVGTCLELAALHSHGCPGPRLCLTLATANTDAADFLVRADREFQACESSDRRYA